MKAKTTLWVTLFCLFSWLSQSALAQQNGESGTKSEKKIVITKRTTDADGSEITETIVKKGQAAENFDAEKYIRENKTDKVQVEVRVEDSNIKWEKKGNTNRTNNVTINTGSGSWAASSWGGCDDTRAFLGVEEDSDEKASEEGLVVQIVKGSAAAKAGLKTNDKILKINDKNMTRWSDLSNFIDDAKSGDKVKIVYERNGKKAETEATLTTRKEVKCDPEDCRHGFLGVSPDDEDDKDKREPGVEVEITRNSGAEKAGLRDGDIILKLNDTDIKDFEDISDFMSDTKSGDKIKVTYKRDGKTETTEATLGAQESWNWNGSVINGDCNTYTINLNGLEENIEDLGENMENWGEKMGTWGENFGEKMERWGENFGEKFGETFDRNSDQNWSFNVKEKDACLGVYTHAYTLNDESESGAKISGFTDASAAEEVNMQKGDVILSVNGSRVNNHDDLWNEIAKYNPADKVKVEYQRNGETKQVEATLKACKDNSSQVIINETSDNGDNRSRSFTTWNWDEKDEKDLRSRRVITIHKGDGDAPTTDPSVQERNAADRKLVVENFKAYPNPTQGQMTVEFRAQQLPTIVTLYDLGGRQLFREEMNAFDGTYYQQFDLSEYAKGTILIQVQQADKVFIDRVVVN